MNPRRGIATVCLSGTLEDKLNAAAGAGFDGVEIFEPDLIASGRSPAEIRALCADLGLSIDLYQPFRDFEGVGPQALAANLRRAEHKFAVMRELGVDTLLVCSSVGADTVGDRVLIADQLRTLAERAYDHGMRIAYEALAWGRHISTWRDAWQVVRDADHPALGLCLDSFHVLACEPDPAGIEELPGDKLFFLQLADAPRLHMDLLSWSRHHRLFPGQGELDVRGFVQRVLAAGYRGPLSLEVFNDVFRQAAPQPTAHAAMRSLLALEGATGVLELPPPARLSGFSSVEITVDPRTRREVTATLDALGFTQDARHRLRPVELWADQEARILVHTDAKSQERAAITGLTLESDDPKRASNRADRLSGRLGPRADAGQLPDAPLHITAPDLVSVHFGPAGGAEYADPEQWAAGAPAREPDAAASRVTRIVRVTLTQPFDEFHESTLFYRSGVGLTTTAEEELAAPFGMIRSRTSADSDGRVQVALTSTLERRGAWAPRVPDPQHVTFATDDIFEAARAVRLRGVQVLPIPENYFADLEARIPLEPQFAERLREHDILYDRDEHGEMFHFFTALHGERVFFEVVQTTGAYGGTGAAHVPLRMAAHRALRERDRGGKRH